MSTTTELIDGPQVGAADSALARRLAAGWKHVLVTAVFGVFYLYLSYLPLFHTDIWGHVSYGRWMLDHGSIPAEDPYMPLAAGMRVVDSAWLSQLLLGWVTLRFGPEGLSALFASIVLTTYVIFTRDFFLISGRISLALFGSGLTLFLFFGRHSIIRPEIFGVLCFAALLWLLVRAEPWRSRSAAFAGSADLDRTSRWLLWLGIPLLFLVWVNVHGSFLIGIMILGAHVVGRIIEVLWQKRSLVAVLRDPWVIRWAFLTELAFAATLINPYGMDLVIETAVFSQNKNLKDILEWYSLKLVDAEGYQLSLAVLLWITLYRHSRQRVHPTDLILLLVFAAGVAKAIRIIGWFAAVFALCMMPHVADVGGRLLDHAARVWGRWRPAWFGRSKPAFGLLCLLLAWVAFAGSPLGGLVLGGKPRPPQSIYSAQTPLGITEYLRKKPPQGLVYVPQWWSDWLTWDGPEGIKTVVSTNVHLVPNLVWDGYMQVSRAGEYWEDLLNRWNVDTVVADKAEQKRLTSLLRGSDQWRVVYEDDLGIVVRRVTRN